MAAGALPKLYKVCALANQTHQIRRLHIITCTHAQLRSAVTSPMAVALGHIAMAPAKSRCQTATHVTSTRHIYATCTIRSDHTFNCV